MTLQDLAKITKGHAESDIERLKDVKEMTLDNTKFGRVVGHFAGNSFFFYSQGNEIFRNSDKSKAIKFLQNSYNIQIK